MTDEELIEQVARDIADALGDNFNYAFAGKADRTAHRGETPAGFRDVNQPYKPDYIDAAQAALAAINLPAQLEASYTQGWNEAIEAAARYVQDNYPHDKRALVPAIRALTKENGDD